MKFLGCIKKQGEMAREAYNDKYRRTRDERKLKVIIVLDDLDRLQGEDILSTLAFLSIVRRLEFVKIILPLSLKTVGATLDSANVPEPRQFIQKYLPERSVVGIKSGMDVVERIVLQKIKGMQENPPSDGTEFCAAWAAMLVRKISGWLDERADSCGWDGRGASESSSALKRGFEFPERVKSDAGLCYVIEHSYSTVRDVMLRVERGLKYDLDRPGRGSDLRHFEDVILKVRKGLSGSAKQYLALQFDENDYWDIVASWIFKFTEDHWEYLDISLRSMLDIVNDCNLVGLSLNKAEQFTQVFNQLFPNNQIIYDGAVMDALSVA